MRLFWHHALPYASSNNLNVCRCLGAVLSGKRFLASVWKHVGLQILGASGRVAALLTRKGLFSSVCEHVAPQITSLSTTIVTLVTSERLLSWMDQHVFLEVRGCCAGEFTLCAAEEVFPRMDLMCFLRPRTFLLNVWACASWGDQFLCRSNEWVCMCFLRSQVAEIE